MSNHLTELAELRQFGIHVYLPQEVTGSASKLSVMMMHRKIPRRSSDGSSHVSTGIFGRTLSEQPCTQIDSAGSVPSVLAACCEYLSDHLTTAEGLFRVEGAKMRQRDLRERLDSGRFDIPQGTPPQDVCAVLKAWLRELPEPLLSHALAKTLSATNPATSNAPTIEEPEGVGRKIVCLSCRVLLPSDSLQARALRYLCQFLNRVAAASKCNRMDAANLSTCLGPSLYGGAVSAESAAKLNSSVALLISFASEIHAVESNRFLTVPNQTFQLPPPSRRRSSGLRTVFTRVVSRFSRSRSRSPHVAGVADCVDVDGSASFSAVTPTVSKRRRLSQHHLSCPSEAATAGLQLLPLHAPLKHRSYVASPHPEFRRPRPVHSVEQPRRPQQLPSQPPPPQPPALLTPMLLKPAATPSLLMKRHQLQQLPAAGRPLRAVHILATKQLQVPVLKVEGCVV